MVAGIHRAADRGDVRAHAGRGLVVGDEDGLDRVVAVRLQRGLEVGRRGAGAPGGVELPDTFDLKGVIKLLASLFGLT